MKFQYIMNKNEISAKLLKIHLLIMAFISVDNITIYIWSHIVFIFNVNTIIKIELILSLILSNLRMVNLYWLFFLRLFNFFFFKNPFYRTHEKWDLYLRIQLFCVFIYYIITRFVIVLYSCLFIEKLFDEPWLLYLVEKIPI